MKNIFRKKKEKKNIVVEVMKYVVPIVIAVLLFCIIKFGILNRSYSIKKISVDRYTSLVNSVESSLIYVTTTECETCDTAEELIKKVLQGSDIVTYEVNTGELTNEELETFMNVFDKENEGVVTPSLMVVNNGNIASSFEGPFDEDLFIEYLQENELVD